jgi:DNA-directed RNA polymerase specialized sigma24 family protein
MPSSDNPLPDDDIRATLARDPVEGWRIFIERYTDTLLATIVRAGVRERDEVMDVYTRVCVHLSADGCARLRRHDSSRGTLGAWLVVVVRNAVVDLVRSRVGRRRMFKAVRSLDAFDRRVFELYYWSGQRPGDIAERLQVEERRTVGLGDVLTALERIHQVLEQRQRAELLSTMVRQRPPLSLHDEEGRLAVDPPSRARTPEQAAMAAERERQFAAALATLPVEEAAIVRLRFVQGLSLAQVRRALHLEALTGERVREILARLRQALEAHDLRAADLVAAEVPFPPASVPGEGPPLPGKEPA